ncbi:hypothetical protein AVDCRST_MAG94-4213, partial [uncultured Leptolyngbya sp.]
WWWVGGGTVCGVSGGAELWRYSLSPALHLTPPALLARRHALELCSFSRPGRCTALAAKSGRWLYFQPSAVAGALCRSDRPADQRTSQL